MVNMIDLVLFLFSLIATTTFILDSDIFHQMFWPHGGSITIIIK